MSLQRSNSCILQIGALLLISGCASLSDYHYEHTQRMRARSQYRECANPECSRYPSDYKKGWVDGFYEVSTGGSSCPPAIAPPRYWEPGQIIEDCDNRRHAYYSGWQDGAARASEFPDTHHLKVFETCECPFPRCDCLQPSCGSPGGCVGCNQQGMAFHPGIIEQDQEVILTPGSDEVEETVVQQSAPLSPVVDPPASSGLIELPRPTEPSGSVPAPASDDPNDMQAIAPPMLDTPSVDGSSQPADDVASPSDNAEPTTPEKAEGALPAPLSTPLPPPAATPPTETPAAMKESVSGEKTETQQSTPEQPDTRREDSIEKSTEASTGFVLPRTHSVAKGSPSQPSVRYLFGDDNSQTIEFGPQPSFTDSVNDRLGVDRPGTGLIELK